MVKTCKKTPLSGGFPDWFSRLPSGLRKSVEKVPHAKLTAANVGCPKAPKLGPQETLPGDFTRIPALDG
jgi:hypothetical protein